MTKKRIGTIILSAIAAISLTFSAAAEGLSTIDVGNEVKTGFTAVANDMLGMISKLLPVGLGLVGAVLAITFGIKFFKKLTGRA